VSFEIDFVEKKIARFLALKKRLFLKNHKKIDAQIF